MNVAARLRRAGLIAAAAGCLCIGGSLPALAETEGVKPVCFDASDGAQLCYTERLLDDPSTPLLLFVPGWTMPAAIWEKQIAHFAGRYSLVAFDPRGQGESAAPRHGYTLERRIRDLKELLDRFSDRPVVMVGWSLAVLEMLAYVREYGEEGLAGLVLVDNSVGEGRAPPERAGKNPFFEELRTRREETLRDFSRQIFRVDPGAHMYAKVLASALKTEVEDSIRLLSYGKPREYWKESIHRFSRPILYLVTPKWREQAEALARKHPKATVQVFEHAGHALFHDEPERFNRAVEDFVTRLPRLARDAQR